MKYKWHECVILPYPYTIRPDLYYAEVYKNIYDNNDNMQFQTLRGWIFFVKIDIYFVIDK